MKEIFVSRLVENGYRAVCLILDEKECEKEDCQPYDNRLCIKRIMDDKIKQKGG